MRGQGTAPPPDEDVKTKLRRLRDRLALEAPRARVRAPAEVAQQLEAAAAQVSRVYLLSVAAAATVAPELAEAQEDAIAEGHLALVAWERCQASQTAAKKTPSVPGINRREHERLPITATAKLLRHTVREDGSGALLLDAATTSRAARNVSLGGIFVTLAKGELPAIGVGHVVHVLIAPANAGAAESYELTATVVRREESGVGLRWMLKTERDRVAVEKLLESIRPKRP
jgi:hypothetical protein